jgi:hypothetical protein
MPFEISFCYCRWYNDVTDIEVKEVCIISRNPQYRRIDNFERELSIFSGDT